MTLEEAIIHCKKKACDNTQCVFEHRQLAEWLQELQKYQEKQKEHSMSAEEALTRAGLKPYKDGNQWCILAGDNIQEGICGFGDTINEALYQFLTEVLEKQKEQKELPLMDGNADLYFDEWNQQKQNPTKRQCFEEGMRYAERLQKEQKPDDQYVHGYYEGFSDSAKAYRPAEWNEEDEWKRNELLKYLEEKGDYRSTWYSWLKSLRSRPKSSDTWKPSEEQMKALLSKLPVIKGGGDKVQDILESLYNDLKKLM